MTLTPFILLGVGLILVFLEFFFPGGILAIVAGAVLLASIVLFALESTSFVWTLLYAAGIILLVVLLIALMIARLRKGKFKGIFLGNAQNGYVASSYDKELIGKRGKALSDLKPSGHIVVEEKRYQAVSKTGYVEKDSQVEVVGGEGAHLIVKEVK